MISCVLAHCPGLDATSFYRGYRPLAMLRQMMDLQIIVGYDPSKIDWELISIADIAFIQRPFSSHHLELAHKIKAWGIPLWLDYDDDLMHLPLSNPAFEMYRQPHVRDNITRINELADVITVTTEFLKQQIKHPDVRVIPNALDNYAFKRYENIKNKRNIMWRGGESHIRDLLIVWEQITTAANNDKNGWTWSFMGYNPFFVTEKMPLDRTSFFPKLKLIHYFEALQKNAAAVQMVPLDPVTFNYSKSNIAYLEGTLAGSVVVCPDWQQWQETGALNYKNPDEFGKALQEAMSMSPSQIKARNQEAWDNVERKYLLSNVNEMRKNIILEFRDKRRSSICKTTHSKQEPKSTQKVNLKEPMLSSLDSL